MKDRDVPTKNTCQVSQEKYEECTLVEQKGRCRLYSATFLLDASAFPLSLPLKASW